MMMRRFLPFIRFLRQHAGVVGLVLLAVVVCGLNYKSGTWLTGWDNLHPEFDFRLNLRRSLFAVWQEYQGVGLLGGMGHAADLPRQVILWVLSLLIPARLLRYVWTFGMLLIGPVGVYALIQSVFKSRKHSELAATMGGVFYLLNLATVQIFAVPFEAFTTHFGFLPWLLWGAVRYMRKPSWQRLGGFAGINLLAATQAYVPTVWIVYMALLVIFLMGLLGEKGKFGRWREAMKILLSALMVNLFWLLPFGYFSIRNISAPLKAHMNQLSTEDAYLRDKVFGDFSDVLRLKGFWFDYVELQHDGSSTYLLHAWREHLSLGWVKVLGWVFVGILLLGFGHMVYHKQRGRWAFLGLFLFPFILLANNTIPFSWLNGGLRTALPLFAQVFRSPFTKFSISLSLAMSVGFGWGCMVFASWFRQGKVLLTTALVLLVMAYAWPVFQGQLFFARVQAVIPQQYFELMRYFADSSKAGRIANFPQNTSVGWKAYDWGPVGSGFEWYGVSQPILDRAFDVWSRYNENYYWEIARAVYAEDVVGVEAVLQKYSVRWVVLDENVGAYGSARALYLDRLREMLGRIAGVQFKERFGGIDVYETAFGHNGSFVYGVDKSVGVGSSYAWGDHDQAFLDWGDYVVQSNGDVDYPFRSVFSGRGQLEGGVSVEEKVDALVFRAPESSLLETNRGLTEATESGDIQVDQKSGIVEVFIPKQKDFFGVGQELFLSTFANTVQGCNPFNRGPKKRTIAMIGDKPYLELTSKSASNCIVLEFPQIPQRYAYIMAIDTQYLKGKPLLLRVVNKGTDRVELETYLPRASNPTTSYLVLPEGQMYGGGYELVIDNISIGDAESVNRLGRLAIYPVPAHLLEQLKIQKSVVSKGQVTDALYIVHPNEVYYRVGISGMNEDGILALSQGFDEGWKAYQIQDSRFKIYEATQRFLPFIFGKELKDHVLVSNWANGWRLTNNSITNSSIISDETTGKQVEIVIFYWPQLLEWVGLGILVLSMMYLVFKGRHRKFLTKFKV